MTPERRAVAACAAALFAASFLVRVPLARAWSALGVLEQHDVLFDADPVVYLQAFGDGDMRDRMWRAHPNVRNLVNPPVRLLAALVRVVRPDWTVERARREVALLVAPAASAATTATIFLTLRLLGASIAAAAAGALVEMSAFSGLVFGSIPESYPLSGAVLAAAFLLLADAVRSGRLRGLAWVLVASTAFGITTTNLGIVAILLFLAASRTARSLPRAAGVTAAVLALAVAVAAAEFFAVNAAYGEWVAMRKFERTDTYLAPRAGETFRAFPEAVVSTVLPDRPAVVTNEIGLRRDYPIKLGFTMEDGPQGFVSGLLRGLVVAGFLLLGALQLARAGGIGRPILGAAAAVLVFNLVLHSAYRGPDLLLYSMHWHAALALVLGATALAPRRAAAVLLAVAVAFNNAVVLWWMLRTLRAMS